MNADIDLALFKQDNYRQDKYKIETRQLQLTSPILHIGSAVSRLNPFEYVQTEDYVYQPNQDALAKALGQRGFLDDYIQRISDREEIISLLENAFGNNWHTLTMDDGHPVFPPERRSVKWTDQKISDLRPMIRNGMGQLYIPGSSIKGAIRTAIAYHLLKHAEKYNVPQQNRISNIENQLRKSLGELKSSRYKQSRYDDRAFMDELFTNFSLEGSRGRNRTGPNTDFMRAVHISDCEPIESDNVCNLPVVAEVVVSSRFSDDQAKYRASIYAELVHNLQTEFTIILDHKLLSKFSHNRDMTIPFESVDDIIKICQEFAQDQWTFEGRYWTEIKNNPDADGRVLNFNQIQQQLYTAERCPYSLRLGWASGMPGTTVNLLLNDDLRATVRDTCGIKAPGFAAPKSRRTVMNSSGDIEYAPGWVELKVSASC